MKTVVGMFNDIGEAQRTFDDLMRLGVNPNDISIVTRSSERIGSDRMRMFSVESTDAGRVSAAGPIASVLAQRQVGLVGTLRNAGVSPALAEHYAAAVGQGETLESVVVDDRNADRVVEVMKRRAARFGPTDRMAETRTAPAAAAAIAGAGIGARTPASTTATSATGPSAQPSQPGMFERAKEAVAEKLGRHEGSNVNERVDEYIPVMREEIQIGKREVDRGGVHVDVHVTEHPVSEHIRLREEHVEVERRPANRAPRPDEELFRGRQLDMTEHGEEPVISKQVRVVEEIRLHKTVTEREEVVNDKLRSTEIDIDELAGDRRAYRAHFESLGGRGTFEDELPGYEFGRSLRGPGVQRWEDVESNARTRWEAKRPGTWERFKDSIQYAFTRGRNR